MMNCRLLVLAPVLALVISTTVAGSDSDVRWVGTLHAVHQGDISAHVDLKDYAGRSTLVAVGPAAGGDGEVTILDGVLHLARVRDGQVKADSSFANNASLLVWADIGGWRPTVPLGVPVDSTAQLGERIGALAKEAGVDTSKPFPVKIEGEFANIGYHVRVLADPAKAPEGQKVLDQPFSSAKSTAVLVGFYSTGHGGVFTHRGSVVHLHAIERSGGSGHLDAVTADGNVRISFPK